MKQLYNERLSLVQIDLEDQGSVDQACSTITSAFKRVDLLINVAGMLGDKSSAGPERSITAMDRDWLTKTFDVSQEQRPLMTYSMHACMCEERMI
jgi:NADP-dependent 3-hydroxy acid dehydrogenase YdfG